MNVSTRQRLMATTLLFSAAVFAAPAYAQTENPETAPTTAEEPKDDEGDAIVVTGTRIVRPDLEAASPVAVISEEAIKETNVVTVEQILSANPQFAAGTGGASNNPGDGSASVDLRGLGPQRTLVLIDGKRAPAYDTTGVVDLNAIPTALIKRVEVLTGGASAVYGSDAVSGVVNFVMNDRFKGLQFDGSAQVSKYGDASLYNTSLTGGMNIGSRGNLVASIGYAKRAPLFFNDRSYTRQALGSYDFLPTGSSNAVPTVFDIPGQDDQFQVTPAGTLVPFYQPYNYNPVNYAVLPFDRWNAMALARYELTDNVELYGRANYARIHVATNLAATATAGFGFNLDPTNPFLTPSQLDLFFNTVANPNLVINDGSDVANDPTARAGTSQIGIRRRVTETGGRLTDTTTKNQQYVGGIRGTLSTFNYDLFAQYGKSVKNQILRNDLSYTALQQALDVVAGPGGVPVCFDQSNGCVPLNVFTTDPIPQDALAFVLRNALQDNKVTQFIVGGNIGGDVTFLRSPLASNPAAVSFGAEYRKEKGTTKVDDNYASGDLIYYGQGQNISGGYDVKEIYGEIKMPLVQDRPGVENLAFEAGARFSDYSTVGGVWTYKVGGDYEPVKGFRARSIYQRAVRAPSIFELYSPVVAGTGGLVTDPCGPGTVSAAVRDLCVAQGAPANRFTPSGGGFTSTIVGPIVGQINIFTGGNPNLTEETSDTFTVGAVLNPPQLRGFSASVDYYKIKIADAISSTSPSIIAEACYSNPSTSNPACAGIVRNPLTGSLSGDTTIGLPTVLGNVAAIKTSGIDVAANYYGGNRDGFHYALGFNGTYLLKYTFELAGEIAQCAGKFGPECDLDPMPKWKHVADIGLSYRNVTFNTRWRHFGGVKGDEIVNPANPTPDNPAILTNTIPAFNYFDQTVSFDVGERYTFRLGVLNLFNKKPPIVGEDTGVEVSGGGTFPNTYDVVGRSFFASVTAKLF